MVAVFITNLIVQAVIGIGLSVVASKLVQKKEEPQQDTGGAILDIEYGEDTSRKVAIGKCAVRGLAVYDQTFGEANFRLQKVLKLSDFYTSGLQRVAIDGEWVTLGDEHEVLGYPVTSGDYAGFIWIKYYPGNQLQADFYLASNGRWPASGFGYAVSYAIVTLDYNQEKLTTIPEIVIEFLGAPLYDPRKDTTAGGSGSHRWDDVSTWEYTANPIIADYNYRRGIYTGVWNSGHDTFMGMGVPAAELNYARYAAAANICDETVEGENRYVVSMLLDANREHGDNIEDLMLSCAGMVVESVDGSYPILGATQTPVATLTDDDLIVGEPFEFRRYRPMNEVVNTVFGTYIEPNFVYANTGYTEQTSSSAVTLDRRTLDFQLNLPMVPSKRQAEQLASIYFSENRYETRKTVTVREKWQILEVGDWIEWENDRDGAASRIYQVVGMTIASYGEKLPRAVTLNLQERHEDIYAGIGPVTPPTAIPRNDAPVYLQELANFQVVAVYQATDSDIPVPAILATWNAITDVTVDSIRMQHRVASDDSTLVEKLIDASATSTILQEGVVGSTGYQVRHKLVPSPARTTVWSAWVSVTTLDPVIATNEDVVDKLNEFEDDWRRLTGFDVRRMAEDIIEGARTLIDTHKSKIREITYDTRITEERTTRITEDEAISERVVEVFAATETNAANITAEQEARTDADGALATDILTVQAATGTNAAAILNETTARTTAIAAEAAQRVLLAAEVDQNTADILAEAIARATADAAEVVLREALAVEVDANAAAIVNEATTRATAIAAEAAARAALAVLVSNNAAAITSEATTRAAADAAEATARLALGTSLNSAITSAVATEAAARSSGDSANATLANAAQATANNATAGGLVKLETATTNSGATATYGVYLRASVGGSYTTEAAYWLDIVGGQSRMTIAANKLRLVNSSGEPYSIFNAAGSQINGVYFQDNSINASKLVVGSITADYITTGTITAAKIISGGISQPQQYYQATNSSSFSSGGGSFNMAPLFVPAGAQSVILIAGVFINTTFTGDTGTELALYTVSIQRSYNGSTYTDIMFGEITKGATGGGILVIGNLSWMDVPGAAAWYRIRVQDTGGTARNSYVAAGSALSLLAVSR